MKFLSVRNRAPSTFMSKGPGKNKKKGGPSLMSSSSQAGQLTSSQACDIGYYKIKQKG